MAQRLGLIALAIGLLSGCASVAGGDSGSQLAVPTNAKISGADGDQGALQGKLQALRTGAQVCYFVDGPNGRAFIVTRSGSYASEDLTLHANGSSPAQPGKNYLFLGAPDWPKSLHGCPGSGVPWYTGEVRRAQPEYADATLAPVKTRAP